MKTDGQDGQEVNQQPQESNTENPGATAESLVDNNGHKSSELERGNAGEASEIRTVSVRKVAANRRNAQNSTGPKTAAGKKIVSANAMKHGFYSKFLLVKHQDGEEGQAEYDSFYGDVFKHYQPVGWLEENWVDKIAVWSWRLRRVIRYESGQIARALAEHRYDLQQSKADDAEEPGSAPARSCELDALTDHLFMPTEGLEIQLRCEAMINRQLNHAIAELERLQASRKNGGITKQSQEVI
jgi:hypothetical protein